MDNVHPLSCESYPKCQKERDLRLPASHHCQWQSRTITELEEKIADASKCTESLVKTAVSTSTLPDRGKVQGSVSPCLATSKPETRAADSASRYTLRDERCMSVVLELLLLDENLACPPSRRFYYGPNSVNLSNSSCNPDDLHQLPPRIFQAAWRGGGSDAFGKGP